MNPGQMRDRITFLTEKTIPGPVPHQGYEPFVSVWAQVEYLKGREFWSAKAVNAETTVTFMIRYRNDIKSDMLVEFQGNQYNITAILPVDNKKSYILVHGKEVETVGG